MPFSSFSLGLLSLLALLAPSAGAQSTPKGLALTVDGGRLGDTISFDIAGAPFTRGRVAIDFGGTASSGRVRPALAGASSQVFSFSFLLDANGNAHRTLLLPADPVLLGRTLGAQAFTASAGPASGLTLSDRTVWGSTPPRVFTFWRGNFVNGSGFPANLNSTNALTGMEDFTLQLPGNALDAIWVPSLSSVALLQTDGTLSRIDPATGATLTSLVLSPVPDSSTVLRTTGIPGAVRVMTPHRPNGAGMRLVDLVQGQILGTIPTSAGRGLEIPGTTHVAITTRNAGILLLDDATQSPIWSAPIPSTNGFLTDMTVQGNRLLILLSGVASPLPPLTGTPIPAAIYALDLATGAPLFPVPVEIPSAGIALGSRLRLGPGPGGEVAVVLFRASSGESQLVALSGTTFQEVATVDVNPTPRNGIVDMVPTAGGTEWLALGPGNPSFAPNPGEMIVIDSSTFTVLSTVLLPVERQTDLITLPSDSIRSVFVSSQSGTLLELTTDPTTGAQSAHTLPLIGPTRRLFTDN